MVIKKSIIDCINENKSFILEAGAGSGKTYTLIESLKYIIKDSKQFLKNKKIACITYTNVAKNEIIERTEYNEKIDVYTIHEFLWNIIKNFQKELAEITKSKLISENEKKTFENIEKIQYRNYKKYEEGIISHDDVIKFSEILFEKYPKLAAITAYCYKYIFIDEYQDTNEKVLKIVFEKIKPQKTVIGCFGDSIQKIYPGKIYNIREHEIEEIKKIENYRCSIEVINLLNKLRDDIQQIPAGENLKGKIKFYYNPLNKPFLFKDLEIEFKGINKENSKFLCLVHKRIAKENGYIEFFEILSEFEKRDNFIDNLNNRGSKIINYLIEIENICQLYQEEKIQLLLKKITFILNSTKSKEKLKTILDKLIELKNNRNILDIINYLNEIEILPFTIEEEEQKLFDELKDLKFKQVSEMYKIYLNEDSYFRTNHGTKGDEFENVIVTIDDSDWKNYNYSKFFSNELNDSNRERVRNLFYVSCSRAKNYLIINMTGEITKKAKNGIIELFGQKNYQEI